MSFPIIIANRLIKIFGAITKGFSYIFHFFFPQKRFIIPIESDSLIQTQKDSKIPRIIWQTNYSNNASLPVYLNYIFNRIMSPTYKYRYVSTEDRLQFIKDHAPQRYYEAFAKLTDGAAQADFWRLFVLNHTGGVYMDIDAHVVWPLGYMISDQESEVFLKNKQHYTNYFIASSKNNPILEKALEIIVENIEQKKVDGGVYALTGPNVLNLAIGDKGVHSRYYRITCNQGSFTNEYFQYIDKPRGKWTHAKSEDLLKDKEK